jgi:hypothetical protein
MSQSVCVLTSDTFQWGGAISQKNKEHKRDVLIVSSSNLHVDYSTKVWNGAFGLGFCERGNEHLVS